MKTMAKSSHPLWLSYKAMINRCHNPSVEKYPIYGARGIAVCDEWRKDFWAFVAHVGDRPSQRHSIERKDTNGNYEPSNVVWATPEEQQANTRRSVRYTIEGASYSIRQLRDMSGGMSTHAIMNRIANGLSLAEITHRGPIKTRKPSPNSLPSTVGLRHERNRCARGHEVAPGLPCAECLRLRNQAKDEGIRAISSKSRVYGHGQ